MNLSNLTSSGKGSGNPIIWIVVAGLAIIVGGFLISLVTPALFPVEGSTQAQQVDGLFRFMLVIAGAIFLLVQGVLGYSVLRFRAPKGDTSDGPAIHGNTTLEFVWTVIPAVLVLSITIYAYQVFQSTRAPQPNERAVHVTAARFAWTFTYDITQDMIPADVNFDDLTEEVKADFEDDGVVQFSSPQLHTWVNQPMVMEMNSQDVIHSFWVPAMRVKQDVMPGRTTDIRFTPIEAGQYRIVCAELCGSGHGNMAGSQDNDGNLLNAWLVVHADEAAFMHEFFTPNMNQIIFPPTDPIALGRQILAGGKYPCATCHTLTDLGWQGKIGPSLDGIGIREQRLSQAGEPDILSYIHDSVRQPHAFLVPGFGPLMPQFNPEPDQPNYMPEGDLTAIMAYLASQTGQ
jgi:cytochrome c oxidase subunit II